MHAGLPHSGKYKTTSFAPLTLTFPDDGWTVEEETGSELRLQRGNRQQWLVFFPDPVPVDNRGQGAVTDVALTPAALTDWLQSNPDVVATNVKTRTFSGDTEARTVDVVTSPTAKNGDSSCPARLRPCVNLFRITLEAPATFDFGTASTEKMRLVFASTGPKNDPTMLMAVIEAQHKRDFAELAPIAEAVINKARAT